MTTTARPSTPPAAVPVPPFSAADALPPSVFAQITDVRVQHPKWILKEARQRERRPRLAEDGKLVLLALDHPGRGVNQIRGDALAMGNRHELLARARRAFDDLSVLEDGLAVDDAVRDTVGTRDEARLTGRQVVHPLRRSRRHLVRVEHDHVGEVAGLQQTTPRDAIRAGGIRSEATHRGFQ